MQNSDGDGTVPIISTGLMCYKGWRNNKKLNPASIPIVSREYLHQPSKSYLDLRCAQSQALHRPCVLGNTDSRMDPVTDSHKNPVTSCSGKRALHFPHKQPSSARIPLAMPCEDRCPICNPSCLHLIVGRPVHPYNTHSGPVHSD